MNFYSYWNPASLAHPPTQRTVTFKCSEDAALVLNICFACLRATGGYQRSRVRSQVSKVGLNGCAFMRSWIYEIPQRNTFLYHVRAW